MAKNFTLTKFGDSVEIDDGSGNDPELVYIDNINTSIQNDQLVITDNMQEVCRAKINEISSVSGSTLKEKARTLALNIFTRASTALLTTLIDVFNNFVAKIRPIGTAKVADMGIVSKMITTESPLIAIRIKSGNDSSKLIPTGISIIGASSGKIKYTAYLLDAANESDLSGANWVTQGTACISEYSIDAAMTLGLINAHKLSTDYFSNRSNMGFSDFTSTDTASVTGGVSDILILTAAKVGGGNESVTASFKYDEL